MIRPATIYDFHFENSPRWENTVSSDTEKKELKDRPLQLLKQSIPVVTFLGGILVGVMFYHLCGPEVVSDVLIDVGVMISLIGMIGIAHHYYYSMN